MSLKGRSCWVVNICMVRSEELSLEAIGRFVAASEEVRFEAEDRQQLYGWVERVLVGRQYAQLGKAARGLVRRYIEKMTGLSRVQQAKAKLFEQLRLTAWDRWPTNRAEEMAVCGKPGKR